MFSFAQLGQVTAVACAGQKRIYMTTDNISTGAGAGFIPHAGGQGLAATVIPHYVPTQPMRKADLAPTPTSNIQFDRSAMEKSLKDAVKLLNDQMSSQAQGLGFSYDDSTKTPVVTVRNLESGQVIRQIPSSDLIRLAHRLDELKGILYNAKA
jgi:flagellar protein FlaG